MSGVAEKIATISPQDVTEEELNLLDHHLDELSDQLAEDRREGDLIEFLTQFSESLRQGEKITLYANK